MIVSAIVATAEGNVIGNDGEIPWYLPLDLQYFKQKTLGHHVIMGSNTLRSIGRALPKRTNIVLSRNPFFIVNGCLVAHSVEEAFNLALENDESEVFIIGGAEVYEKTLPYWDKIYWTQVDANVKGDTFFPTINLDEWLLISETFHTKDDKNEYDCTFKVYVKKEITDF